MESIFIIINAGLNPAIIVYMLQRSTRGLTKSTLFELTGENGKKYFTPSGAGDGDPGGSQITSGNATI